MVWNYQSADCSLKNKFIVLLIVISGTLSFPTVRGTTRTSNKYRPLLPKCSDVPQPTGREIEAGQLCLLIPELSMGPVSSTQLIAKWKLWTHKPTQPITQSNSIQPTTNHRVQAHYFTQTSWLPVRHQSTNMTVVSNIPLYNDSEF